MVEGPIRTCAGCRARRPQGELLRVSHRSDGVVAVDVDGSARSPGRGAYLCYDASCVEQALRTGRLRRALRLDGGLPEGIRSQLVETVTGRKRPGNG